MSADSTVDEQKQLAERAATALGLEVQSDKDFADRFRQAVTGLTDLMNESLQRQLTINFSINLSDDLTQDPPRRVYQPVVVVTKAL